MKTSNFLFLLLLATIFASCGGNPPPQRTAYAGTGVYAAPYPSPSPHAQTLKEGEDLENRMAREAEEKAKHEKDADNQVRKEQQKIDDQIQNELDKSEGR